MLGGKYKYYAFISYTKRDEKWAKWLQYELEHYKLPSNLNGRSDLPENIRPVFKDTTELSPGNLSDQIYEALDLSKFLIVICSPRSAESYWVNLEVKTFIEMGKVENIIPFIIDGNAFAKIPIDECFPPALRELPSEREILGANINESGKHAASVKVVAKMFNIKFDVLWQRYERDKRITRYKVLSIFIFIFLIFSALLFYVNIQKTENKEMENKLDETRTELLETRQNEKFDNIKIAERDLGIIPAMNMLLEELPYNYEDENKYVSYLLNLYRRYIYSGHQLLKTSEGYSRNTWERVISVNCINYTSANVLELLSSKDIDYNDVDESNVFHTDKGIFYLVQEEEQYYVSPINESEQNSRKIDVDIYIDKAAISYDGNWIVFENDDSFGLWNTNTGKQVGNMIKCPSEITSLAINASGSYIALGFENGTILIWDTINNKAERNLIGHTDKVSSLSFSPDGKHIASGARDHTIRIWDIETGLQTGLPLIGHTDDIIALSFYSNHNFIVSTSEDQTIRIWHTKHDKNVASLIQALPDAFVSLSFTSDGRNIISSQQLGNLFIWDSLTGKELKNLLKGLDNAIAYALFTNDASHILLIHKETDEFTNWNTYCANGEQTVLDDIFGIHSYDYSKIAFSPNGKFVVAQNHDENLQIWNVDTGNPIGRPLVSSDSTFVSVAVSFNSQWIATGTINGTINIWDSETGNVIGNKFLEHSSPIISIIFSQNDDRMVSVSKDSTFCVWDMKTHDLVISSSFGNLGIPNSVIYTPDGKQIITAFDEEIYSWNAETGIQVGEIVIGNKNFERGESFTTLACSPDGKRIAAGTTFGKILILENLTYQELIRNSKNIIQHIKEVFTNIPKK